MIRKVYLDTCCVIYLLEDVPVFSEQIRKFMAINTDDILCVSPLVLLEALVNVELIGGH
jgi:PIN domain nuclease of toxin-antitoxin system